MQHADRRRPGEPGRRGAHPEDSDDGDRPDAAEVEPGHRAHRGGRVEHPGEDLHEHLGQESAQHRAGAPTDDGEHRGLTEDQPPLVSGFRAEGADDREGAPALGESEGEHQAARGGGEHQGERQLDPGESGQVDRGQAGTDGLATLPLSVTVAEVPSRVWICWATPALSCPPVSTRNAPTAVQGQC